MSDIRLHEIVTRAVVGRGDRRVAWTHAAPAENALSVLGVHVSEAHLEVVAEGGGATLRLVTTCDLWCSLGDETGVRRITSTHEEPATVRLLAPVEGETTTTAQLIRPLRCVQAGIEGNQIRLAFEAAAALEATGTARLWVRTYDLIDESGDYDGVSDSSSASSSDSSSDSSSASSSDSSSGSDVSSSDMAGLSAGDRSHDEAESLSEPDPTGTSTTAFGSSGADAGGSQLDGSGSGETGAALLASIPTRTEGQPAVPVRLGAGLPADLWPARRTSTLTTFQQRSGSTRIAIVQSH